MNMKRLQRQFAIILAALSISIAAPVSARVCSESQNAKEHGWNPRTGDVTERLSAFYDIPSKMAAAQKANDLKRVSSLANEYLSEAAHYRCNWNYGNAIHDANVVLGMHAIEQKNIAIAAAHLRAAGASPGSPQLNSFGPTLILAKAVLDAGDRDAVIAYLDGIEKFWRMDNGAVVKLKAQIASGKRPSFAKFKLRDPLEIYSLPEK
jgi:hypothetical protein